MGSGRYVAWVRSAFLTEVSEFCATTAEKAGNRSGLPWSKQSRVWIGDPLCQIPSLQLTPIVCVRPAKLQVSNMVVLIVHTFGDHTPTHIIADASPRISLNYSNPHHRISCLGIALSKKKCK